VITNLVKLKDVATITAGQSPSGKNFNDNGEGMPFYQGKKDYGDKFLKPPRVWTKSITKVAIQGDILLSVRAPIGALNIATQEICIGRGLTAIRGHEEINKDYLFYVLSQISEGLRGNAGAIFNSLNKTQIENIEFLLPSLAEQERIVVKLDAAFAEIDEAVNVAIAKETEFKKLKASLLSSSLTGDAVMWETQKLSDVIEKGETINPTTNPDTKFSYIDVSSVDRKNFSISKTQTLRGKDAPSRARRLVKTGDVLFATVRPTLQRIAIVPEELNGEVCSTGYIVLRPKASIICSKFIFYYMLSEKVNTQMESLQTGASYPAVNDTQVKKLHISFPSLSEQKIIVERLDAAYSEFKNANEAIVKSKANYLALKSAILSKELQPSEAA